MLQTVKKFQVKDVTYDKQETTMRRKKEKALGLSQMVD